MTPGQRRWLLLVLTIALAARLVWVAIQTRSAVPIDQLPDQREYLTLGRSLLSRGTLALYDARFGQTVYAYRLPGYPVIVAGCGGSVLVLRLAQAFVDTGTVLATFLLARRLSGAVPALVAAAVVSLNPFQVYFSGLLLTETMFAAALAWTLVAACRRAVPLLAGLGIAAFYLRPTALVLAPIIALWVPNPRASGAYNWRAGVLVMVSLGLAVLPWAGRNWLRLGVPVWTTTNDGITFYDGFHEGATGASDQRFTGDLPALRSMNEVERSRDLSRRAWRWAAGHLNRLPMLSLRKVARGWSPVPLSQDFGGPLYRWVGGGYAVPFDVLCVVGLLSRQLTRRSKWLLVTPALVLTAVQVMTVGSIRYRMPAEAPLAVLAGVGAVDCWQWVRRQTGRRRNVSDDSDHAAAGHHPPSPV